MKYIETRTLCAYELRALCIRKNWYTGGTNEEYLGLFDRLTENHLAAEMTTEKLAEIAADILEHSNPDSCADGYLDIPDIMYDLAKACCVTFREA